MKKKENLSISEEESVEMEAPNKKNRKKTFVLLISIGLICVIILITCAILFFTPKKQNMSETQILTSYYENLANENSENLTQFIIPTFESTTSIGKNYNLYLYPEETTNTDISPEQNIKGYNVSSTLLYNLINNGISYLNRAYFTSKDDSIRIIKIETLYQGEKIN